MTMQRVLIFSDCHRSHHDEKAWALLLKVVAGWKPHVIVNLGDYLDCGALSRFGRVHGRQESLQRDVISGKAGLAELRQAAPKARMLYCEGNHEAWLPRYLANVAEALDLQGITIPDVLGLEKLKIEWVPYRDFARVGKLIVTHDLERSGKYAGIQTLEIAQHPIAFGHTHSMSASYRGDAFGTRHVALNTGWLGDVEQISYRHRISARTSHQLGFGVAQIDENGVAWCEPIPIVAYRCVLGRTLYTL